MATASLKWITGPSCMPRAVTLIARRQNYFLHQGLTPLHTYTTSSLSQLLRLKICNLLHISKNYRNLPKSVCSRCSGSGHFPLWFSKRDFTSTCRRYIKRPDSLLRDKVKQTAEQTVKNNNSKSKLPKLADIKRLFSLAAPEKWRLAGAMGFLVISSAVAMSVPFCIGKVIDLIYTSEKEAMMVNLNKFCGLLLCVFLVGGLANFGRVYCLHLASQSMVKRLRETLFSKIMRQEIAFFDKTKTGELVNRLSSDTSVVAQSLSQNISDGFRAVFQALGGIGMMMYVSTKLTLISMGIVPPVAIGSIIYGRYLRKITKNVQDSLASATHVAEERIACIRTVRAFAHEEKECESYTQGVDKVLKLGYKEALARGIFFGFTGFSGNVIIISVFYFGGAMMLGSNITVGDLSAFLLYAAYAGISMNGLTNFYSEMNKSVAASHRIWQLIDRTPDIELNSESKTPGLQLKNFEGNLKFNHVSFSYPLRADMPIFSNLDLNIPAGQVTAVVGPSGSGKSTLSSLLLRFYDPISGCITLDGHDIRQLDPSWLRSSIGTVSQEPILFSTSIAENIAYGAEWPQEVSLEEIHEAAKKANAYNFITSFPSSFDTVVGERGIMLSGGQRQRIAIARAILKNPKILILDEATSALDAESEYLVQEALEHLMVDKTVLVIAHRLSTIKSANRILVLSNGKSVESGTYQELMSLKEGMFRKLVERQTIVT